MSVRSLSIVRRPTIDPHVSATWIAHNAAMAEKRKLLSGQKPVIGSAYTSPIIRQPAVFIPKKRSFFRALWVGFLDAMVLVGIVTTLGALLALGGVIWL